MPVNKNAIIRYHALDQCFSNFGRAYFIDDLIESCNNALYEFGGIEEGVRRRQIFDDINFMESEQGWSIPLERIKEGKRVYYRYNNSKFSIKNQPISEIEAIRIKEAILIFERFKGMPQFDWMDELMVRLNTAFNLKQNSNAIISFENNPYLKGIDFISDLFNSILYKNTIEINYQSYNQSTPSFITVSPYYLKEYNNRWFVFGFNHEFGDISNFALDRIVSFKTSNNKYFENLEIDFEEYFEDIVGVTIPKGNLLTKIIIEITNDRFSYVESKPIHGSQKILLRTLNFTTIELNVIINRELVSLLFSFGADIKIIEPIELIETIKQRAKSLLEKY